MRNDVIRKTVRSRYARVATSQSCCCGSAPADAASRRVGYTDSDLQAAPEGANLGLGCGNPVALASLKAGETVLDLGSGAGFDCFLASPRVGAAGKVIGVDMTPEMLEKARSNARKGKYKNVEFRLGEIENLPVADNSADIIISNCVINLSPDKARVFQEAFRALKPGGRLMVSDIVLTSPLPEAVLKSVGAYVGCVAGAMLKTEYLAAIKAAGFTKVAVVEESPFGMDCCATGDPTAKALAAELHVSRRQFAELASQVISAKISAVKPAPPKAKK